MSKDALRRLLLVTSAILVAFVSTVELFAAHARTTNFRVVSAPSAALARQVAREAERFRRELALEWLGHELPDWPEPCPITVQAAPRMPAGGETSFVFDGGTPSHWQMRVQGSPERILDSVLPHEVTHTIFATHFGQPLPRWADEGACTTVEHESERAKQHTLLIEFLKTDRGIPFRHMFAMREYPDDILPLYSQGYSLARFLIAQGGKPKFIQYIGDGMQTQDWHGTTAAHYGFKNLGELQLSWLAWVKAGSPAMPSPGRTLPDSRLVSAPAAAPPAPTDTESWYVLQAKQPPAQPLQRRMLVGESARTPATPVSRSSDVSGDRATLWR